MLKGNKLRYLFVKVKATGNTIQPLLERNSLTNTLDMSGGFLGSIPPYFFLRTFSCKRNIRKQCSWLKRLVIKLDNLTRLLEVIA